jgi:hypothetical protein
MITAIFDKAGILDKGVFEELDRSIHPHNTSRLTVRRHPIAGLRRDRVSPRPCSTGNWRRRLSRFG